MTAVEPVDRLTAEHDEWRNASEPPAPGRRNRRPRGRVAVLVVALVAGGVSGGIVAAITNGASKGAETANTPVTTAPATSGTVPAGTYPDVAAIITSISRSVVSIDVTITTRDPFGRTVTGAAAGTGLVISANGLIATNAHVVSGAQQITVTLPDGTKATGTLVGTRTAEDLAVVRIDKTGLVPATFGQSSALRVGDLVIAVGNALALDGGPTASLGIVSALDRTITTTEGASYANLIQTDAAINSGDSGGPLVNAAGEVVGINSAAALTAENIGFAIAIDVAAPILAAIYGSG